MNINTILYILLLLGIVTNLPAQCWSEGFTHDTRPEQQWLSCQKKLSPNPNREEGYWLLYDFGIPYNLATTTVWNYNEPSFLQYGITRLAIDYSLDGQIWETWGEIDLTSATGRRNYEGQAGPDLTGISARFILLTAVSTGESNMSCAGLAEVRFDLNTTVVSTEEINPSISLQVYPNPSSDFIEVRLPGQQLQSLQVFNSQGQQIIASSPSQEQITLDVGRFPPGIYLLQVQSKKGKRYQQKVSVF